MDSLASNVVGIVFISLWIVACIFLVIKFVRNKLAPVKTVKAQVANKRRQEVFSKYSGTGKQYKYVVVFSAEGKTLSFFVSEYSYSGYKVKEKGTLTYKGNRLINFK